MAYQAPKGLRQPMSEEAKQRIAEGVRAKAAERREAMGLPPIDHTNPGGYATPQMVEPEIELVRMKEQVFAPGLFVPMKTNKTIDMLFTKEGGIPKACNFIVIGDPGVGKSTVTMDILADLHAEGYEVLFVSAEMTRIDLAGYIERYPKFGEIDILFLGEYCDSNPKVVVEKALKKGYDIVLIDSFAEVQESVKEVNRWPTSMAEKWLIDLMVSHNMGTNDREKNTTFLPIQQVTKGGVFVGSNKLKHNTTGMLELRLEGDTQYIMFSKNRRGDTNKKLYYSLESKENVTYDEKRFNMDGQAREALAEERDQIDAEESVFDKLFAIVEEEENED